MRSTLVSVGVGFVVALAVVLTGSALGQPSHGFWPVEPGLSSSGGRLTGDLCIGTANVPSLQFGSFCNTALIEYQNDRLAIMLANTERWFWSGNTFGGWLNGTVQLENVVPTDALPGLYWGSDFDTGIGSSALDQLAFTAGGVVLIRLVEGVADVIEFGGDLRLDIHKLRFGTDNNAYIWDATGGIGDRLDFYTNDVIKFSLLANSVVVQSSNSVMQLGSSVDLQLNGATARIYDLTGPLMLGIDDPANVHLLVRGDAIAGGDFGFAAGSQLMFSVGNNAVTPSISLEPGTGFYAPFDGDIRVAINGFESYIFQATGFRLNVATSPMLVLEIPSATNPVFVFNGDEDTGLGRAGTDAWSLIGGGVEIMRGQQNAGADVVTINAQIVHTGTDPVLSACGAAPTITGGDSAGKVTIGTGATTSCTTTFATAYVNAPACTIAGDNPAVTYAATTSTTALTITSSTDMASDVISYICFGL